MSEATAAPRHEGETPDGQFRLDCRDYSGGSWASNSLRFDTRENALKYGAELGSRWMGLYMFRAVPVTTPDRQPYEPGSEDRRY